MNIGPELRRTQAISVGIVLVFAAGCSLSGLGGREKYWPESDQRAPSIWRGILRIHASGSRLDTPEGDVIPLLSGALSTRIGSGGVGELVRGQ